MRIRDIPKELKTELLNKVRQVVRDPLPEYDMNEVLEATGGPHEVPRGYYTSFSGVDIQVYFEDEYRNFVCVPEIQAVSCSVGGDFIGGTLIHLLFDQDILAHLPLRPKNMLLIAANEYGALSYTKFHDITFEVKRYAVAVDDIVSEIRTDFSAREYTPWTRVGAGPKETLSLIDGVQLERLRSLANPEADPR